MRSRNRAAIAFAAIVLWGCAPSLSATPAESTPEPVAAMAHMSGPSTAPAGGQATDTTRVSVTGSASISVPSDRARIRLAVETEGPSAAEAADRNARLMDAIIRAVRPVAGTDATIATAGYRLFPRYTSDRSVPGGQRITGYQATNTISVTLTDVERMSSVVDAALGAGANRIEDLSFFASDTEPARLEAIALATRRARNEAEVVARTLGLDVLGPESVSISRSAPPSPMRGMVAMEAAVATPMEAADQAVMVTVNITWLLGPGAGR